MFITERDALAVALAKERQIDAPAFAMLKVEDMPFNVGDDLFETDAQLGTQECHSTNSQSSM